MATVELSILNIRACKLLKCGYMAPRPPVLPLHPLPLHSR